MSEVVPGRGLPGCVPLPLLFGVFVFPNRGSAL